MNRHGIEEDITEKYFGSYVSTAQELKYQFNVYKLPNGDIGMYLTQTDFNKQPRVRITTVRDNDKYWFYPHVSFPDLSADITSIAYATEQYARLGKYLERISRISFSFADYED